MSEDTNSANYAGGKRPGAEGADRVQLTFASYNIHKAVGTDRRRDPERILAVLREIDADIIALQEADQRVGERPSVLPKELVDALDWQIVPIAKRARSMGWHGNALLVRRGFEVLSSEPLDLPMIEPRGAARVDLDCYGRRLRLVGTHLDISGLRRREQIRSILRHIRQCGAPCPAIVMGDFNQWGEKSGAMKEFAEDWQLLTPGKSFPSRRAIASFDRIAATMEWQVEEIGVHRSALALEASDHLPIFARLTLPKL